MSTVDTGRPTLLRPPAKMARLPTEVAAKKERACEREAVVHMLDDAL